MKRVLIMTFVLASGVLAAAAAGAATGPASCSVQQNAAELAKSAPKPRPDLSPCAALKGKQKRECEKPRKAQARLEAKAVREKLAATRKALSCCKNPNRKGCG
jgi:hypothetical protein